MCTEGLSSICTVVSNTFFMVIMFVSKLGKKIITSNNQMHYMLSSCQKVLRSTVDIQSGFFPAHNGPFFGEGGHYYVGVVDFIFKNVIFTTKKANY